MGSNCGLVHVLVMHPARWGDAPPARVMGVYASEAQARADAVRLAMSMLDRAHYDPARRFRDLGAGRWLDVWRRDEGCPTFVVESWAEGTAWAAGGRAALAALDLDSRIKAMVDAEGLSPARVRAVLRAWHASPPAHLASWFAPPEALVPLRRAPYRIPDRAAWEARFGTSPTPSTSPSTSPPTSPLTSPAPNAGRERGHPT